MTAYAEGKGYKVVQVYSEKISGGMKNTERVVLQECLEYARANNRHLYLLPWFLCRNG